MATNPTKTDVGSHRNSNGSRVQVGVRIRPLTSQEIQRGGKSSLNVESPSIRMGQRRFTYDAVFADTCGQKDLYDRVSGPLLSSFVDGYNATVMSYGQTGSGKTYTMGSEAHTEPESSSHSGLIPRFITDFFLRLQQKKAVSDYGQDGSHVLLEYNLKASFLEVYGEDVYDLLDASRNSLPLREDSERGIVVVGLKSRTISNTAEALQVLHEGTMNRTTAATLMNLTSSRSHAVFTIHLSQMTRSNNGGKVDVMTTSCFTFVDLAGSERMKKTGAEGERAREGIKINEGLLALGNVINALADDERLAKEKKIHIPYRQSKLTRLLQDALGGNSQTLFLACVSPSDTNASETLSTLNYANRARNIRNAPTKNVDATIAELQRLYAVNRVLQYELVKNRFDGTDKGKLGGVPIGQIDDSLLKREDVEAYMHELYEVAHEMICPGESTSPPLHTMANQFLCGRFDDRTAPLRNATTTRDSMDIGVIESRRMDVQTEKFDHSVLDDVNPDEEMAILDYLLEMQQQDQEFETEMQEDDEKLKEVNGQIEKEEAMLLQLRESLKVYHGLKTRYQELMAEVQQLEMEKTDLARQLERATADPASGCSTAIKQKLERVEMNLSRARRETITHRERCRRAEDQNRNCVVLERKVNELKQAKIALIKKQKHAEHRYRETTEANTKELMLLKRREKAADKKMSKLEHEVRLQKTTLEKRKKYCIKLTEKLKQTEAHLVKLLAMRQRDLVASENKFQNRRASNLSHDRKVKMNPQLLKSLSADEVKSTSYIFDRMVLEKVKQSRLKTKYQDLVKVYGETMRKLVFEIKHLAQLRMDSTCDSDDDDVLNSAILSEKEQSIADLELKVELLDSEMRELSPEIPENLGSSQQDTEEAVSKLMMSMSDSALKSLLFDTFSKFVSIETERQTMKEMLDQKEVALFSFEAEVESLNFKVDTLSKELAGRRNLEKSGEDPFQLLKRALEEKRAVEDKLQRTNEALVQSSDTINMLQSSERKANEAVMVEREKLALAKASSSQATTNLEAQKTVQMLQAVWADLGVEPAVRENVSKAIERSLEETCLRELNKALAMKRSCEHEITTLRSKLDAMKRAMGTCTPSDGCPHENQTLLTKVESLQQIFNELGTPYRFSVARREKILKELKQLVPTLGLTKADLASDLQKLLQGDQSEDMKEKPNENSSNSDLSNESFQALSPNCLNPMFLSSCENGVRKLRVQKSVALVRCRELQLKVSDLLVEMHLNAEEALEVVHCMTRRSESSLPEWWNQKFVEQVLRDIAMKQFLSDPSEMVFKHLGLIEKSITYAASCRGSVSNALKSVIEKAQKTLLDIVGREFDASEAYAGFHDALFRLPALSKDLILSCITEMEALIDGIDSMTQSEIEALTVVWAALKVPPSDRRNFWGNMEKSDSKESSHQKSLFNQETMNLVPFGEEWIEKAVNRAAEVYSNLDLKLEKLRGIHKEVERLRSKQDAKSAILSLDSEIRIMNAKLQDFEEHCNKQRLLSKKTSGGALLKEERFRKQMQSRFVTNLRQLASFLQSWEAQENAPFEASLLSDDARMLVKDPNHMDIWVEERTKFMGLKTVKSPTPIKRPFAAVGLDGTSLSPPRKRQTQPRSVRDSALWISKEKQVVEETRKSVRGMQSEQPTLNLRDTNLHDGLSQGSKQRKTRDFTSLGPFENILSDASSPSRDA